MEKKAHWFCFSFIGTTKESGEDANASVYTGYYSKAINKQMINENKGYAGLNDDAVVISISYLGKMTKAEFEHDVSEAK